MTSPNCMESESPSPSPNPTKLEPPENLSEYTKLEAVMQLRGTAVKSKMWVLMMNEMIKATFVPCSTHRLVSRISFVPQSWPNTWRWWLFTPRCMLLCHLCHKARLEVCQVIQCRPRGVFSLLLSHCYKYCSRVRNDFKRWKEKKHQAIQLVPRQRCYTFLSGALQKALPQMAS